VLVVLVKTPQQTVHPSAYFPVAPLLVAVRRRASLRRRPFTAAVRLRKT
jgi:hypothetical protein